MIKRLICHIWGHCIYADVIASQIMPREYLESEKWKYQVVVCSRCKERCMATEFPLFQKINRLVKGRMETKKELLKQKDEQLMRFLGIEK